MLKVGLTSGIGCGKTTVAQQFQSFGVQVIDADQVARELVQPGQKALSLIIQQFGSEACQDGGHLDRVWMRQKVFSQPESRKQLEAILHPLIRASIQEKMQQAANTPYLIVDVPLLVEKNYQSLFDRIIVVDCSPEQQVSRTQKRDGSDVGLIQAIMAAQVSRAERLRVATDILDNTTSLEALRIQIDALHHQLMLFAAEI